MVAVRIGDLAIISVYTPNSGEGLARLAFRTDEWDAAMRRWCVQLATAGLGPDDVFPTPLALPSSAGAAGVSAAAPSVAGRPPPKGKGGRGKATPPSRTLTAFFKPAAASTAAEAEGGTLTSAGAADAVPDGAAADDVSSVTSSSSSSSSSSESSPDTSPPTASKALERVRATRASARANATTSGGVHSHPLHVMPPIHRGPLRVVLVGDMNVSHTEIDLASPQSNMNKSAGFCDAERASFTRLLTVTADGKYAARPLTETLGYDAAGAIPHVLRKGGLDEDIMGAIASASSSSTPAAPVAAAAAVADAMPAAKRTPTAVDDTAPTALQGAASSDSAADAAASTPLSAQPTAASLAPLSRSRSSVKPLTSAAVLVPSPSSAAAPAARPLFIDSARAFFGLRYGFFTYWSHRFGARFKNVGWRLDYIVTSTSLADDGRLLGAFVVPFGLGSDHCPHALIIRMDEGVVGAPLLGAV